jgi:hypothetical protein
VSGEIVANPLKNSPIPGLHEAATGITRITRKLTEESINLNFSEEENTAVTQSDKATNGAKNLDEIPVRNSSSIDAAATSAATVAVLTIMIEDEHKIEETEPYLALIFSKKPLPVMKPS